MQVWPSYYTPATTGRRSVSSPQETSSPLHLHAAAGEAAEYRHAAAAPSATAAELHTPLSTAATRMYLPSFNHPGGAGACKKRSSLPSICSSLFSTTMCRTTAALYFTSMAVTLMLVVTYSTHQADSKGRAFVSTTTTGSRSRTGLVSSRGDSFTAANQQHHSSSSSSQSRVHLPGVFDTQTAGIQRYTLWGSTANSSAVVIHLWIRLLCHANGTTARGFAIAEEVNQQLPFFIDHPLLPDPIAKNLPQLQLQTPDRKAAWNFTQLHVPYIDGQYPNVWHFQVQLPKDAKPTRLGVQGWDRSVDIQFPGGSGDSSSSCAETTASASQQLPWRQHGTVWSVVSPGAELASDVHAFVMCEHIKHHKQYNMSGMVAVLEGRPKAEELLKASCIRRAVEAGWLYFWIWVSEHIRRSLFSILINF